MLTDRQLATVRLSTASIQRMLPGSQLPGEVVSVPFVFEASQNGTPVKPARPGHG